MKQFIVDAFTDKLFHGNQAAVCVLEKWLPEELMQNIARENNFSETAFTVKNGGKYDLRWFTPGGEIDFCGHATLGTAFVLFNFYEKSAEQITFHTMKKGDLLMTHEADFISMDFPSYKLKKIPVTDEMEAAMGKRPAEAYIDRDLLLVFDDENAVRNLKPNFEKAVLLPGEGIGVTSKGKDFDCVSQFFDPKFKVNEDPVTGSAHCMIAPYWAAKLGKSKIHAYQASERGGELLCEVKGERVVIKGKAVLFSVCDVKID